MEQRAFQTLLLVLLLWHELARHAHKRTPYLKVDTDATSSTQLVYYLRGQNGPAHIDASAGHFFTLRCVLSQTVRCLFHTHTHTRTQPGPIENVNLRGGGGACRRHAPGHLLCAHERGTPRAKGGVGSASAHAHTSQHHLFEEKKGIYEITGNNMTKKGCIFLFFSVIIVTYIVGLIL